MGLAAIVYAPKDSVGGFNRPDVSTPAAPRRQHPIDEGRLCRRKRPFQMLLTIF